jgi:uncharacterized protein (TIGR02300 family)
MHPSPDDRCGVPPSPALGNNVTKPELGTKRICAGCNAKFYDLHKTPIVCPTCEAVFVLPKPAPERSRAAYAPRPVAVTVTAATTAAPETDEAEATLVSADGEGEKEKEADAGVPLLEEMDED